MGAQDDGVDAVSFFSVRHERCPKKRATGEYLFYTMKEIGAFQSVPEWVPDVTVTYRGGGGFDTVSNRYLHNNIDYDFDASGVVEKVEYHYDLIWMRIKPKKRLTKKTIACYLKQFGVAVE
jgi:hypothetical protein